MWIINTYTVSFKLPEDEEVYMAFVEKNDLSKWRVDTCTGGILYTYKTIQSFGVENKNDLPKMQC